MNIINNQKIITNKQIYKILKITKFIKLDNVRIVILENRFDILKSKLLRDYIQFINCFNCEGSYNEHFDNIMIKLYNLEGGTEDKRLYGIGVALHELKHRDDILLYGKTDEKSADKYAKKFLNNNSKVIKGVLKLKDEWEIEDF